MSAGPTATLTDRFALIVRLLRDVLAAHMVKADRTRPLLILVYGRLAWLDRRIATLARRLAAGRRVAPRPRPQTQSTPGETTQALGTKRPTRLRLPSKPGWLVTQARHTVTYGNYFRQLLEDPEMVALLQAAPQLKRQLRPILRLLMFELPPALALPPRPPRIRPPRARPPRAERPKTPRRAPCHGAFRPTEYWRPGPIRPIWTA